MAMLIVVKGKAAVSVTENPTGTVTITVDGDPGQIGTYTKEWPNYVYSSNIDAAAQTLIKNATTLIIKGNINSDDIKTLVAQNQVNNNWTIKNLDMGAATISKISVVADQYSVTSHDFMPNNYTHIDCTNVVLPVASDGILPNNFGSCFTSTLVSVTLPVGYTSLGDYAFSKRSGLTTVNLPEGLLSIGRNAFDQSSISYITLPNTLDSIGIEAFKECQKLTTITFPKNLKSIGDNAFSLTYPKDVYFLGSEAPVVGPNAFDGVTYNGNNGFTPTNYSDAQPIGDTNNGYAERRNYMNGISQSFGVLHLRADLTNEQRAKYIDITRNYEVAIYNSKYKAYYDLYYGSMKIWPGQDSWQHTYNDAVNGVLWDGVTTYDATKYKGLHKFTLTASDVYVDDTRNWPIGTKGQQWWTICVPFNMTKAQVRTTFGENTEVCKLSGVVRNQELKTITLKFQNDVYSSASTDGDIVIKAHESYMIFPTVSPTVDIKFNGYKLVEGGALPTIVDATKEGTSTETANYTYRFIGNYLSTWDAAVNNGVGQPIYMPQYAYFLGAKDTKHVFFYQLGTTGKWNLYTSTVQVFNSATSTAQTYAGEDDSFIFTPGAKMGTLFGNGFEDYTTNIELPTLSGRTMGNEQNVYNLQGQLISKNNTSLDNLPEGIYIVNGKKYVVKK